MYHIVSPGDNTDLIQMKDSLELVRDKIVLVLDVMKSFAKKYKSMPTLGFTHYQPAQLTTVGKRCTIWMQDLVLDFEEIDRLITTLPMRGVKGTTGTQVHHGLYLLITFLIFLIFLIRLHSWSSLTETTRK